MVTRSSFIPRSPRAITSISSRRSRRRSSCGALTEDGGDPPVFPVIVTVSYNQAARMLDGGERVDAVPLPDGIRAWMEPFVAEHYKPEPKKRVRRNDPFADRAASRREPGSRG